MRNTTLFLLVACIVLAFKFQESQAQFSFSLPGKWGHRKRSGFDFSLPGKWGNVGKRSGFDFSLPGQWGGHAKRGYTFTLPGEWGSPNKRNSLGGDCRHLALDVVYDIYRLIQGHASLMNQCAVGALGNDFSNYQGEDNRV